MREFAVLSKYMPPNISEHVGCRDTDEAVAVGLRETNPDCCEGLKSAFEVRDGARATSGDEERSPSGVAAARGGFKSPPAIIPGPGPNKLSSDGRGSRSINLRVPYEVGCQNY